MKVFLLGTAALAIVLLVSCSRRPTSDSVQAASASTKSPAPAPANSAPSKVIPGSKSVAILAGGCFWGMEEILRKVPGIRDTTVGYTGGTLAKPGYEDVSSGTTGHAEAVRIVFDPATISYEELLEKWFFRMHDPTTRNRQGNDVGTQYRSAIFVTSPEQKKVAEAIKRRVDASGKWDAPVVTEIVQAGAFTPAEEDHQDYLEKHPGGYTCHYVRE